MIFAIPRHFEMNLLGCGLFVEGNFLRNRLEGINLRFHVRLNEPVRHSHFGLPIQKEGSLTLIGCGFDGLEIQAGLQELDLKVPFLPLRPGVYTFVCSIFNHGNNIAQGRLADSWQVVPPLVVDTMPLANPQERRAGVLNISAELEVTDGAALIPIRQGKKD